MKQKKEKKRASDVAGAADSWNTHFMAKGPVQLSPHSAWSLWESLRFPTYEWRCEVQLSRRQERGGGWGGGKKNQEWVQQKWTQQREIASEKGADQLSLMMSHTLQNKLTERLNDKLSEWMLRP